MSHEILDEAADWISNNFLWQCKGKFRSSSSGSEVDSNMIRSKLAIASLNQHTCGVGKKFELIYFYIYVTLICELSFK